MRAPRYLGLDLGGTNIKLVVLETAPDDAPRVVASDSVPTLADRGPDVVIERLVEVGLQALNGHGPILGVGMGVPGLFDQRTGVIDLFPNLPGGWHGQPLRDRLVAGLDLPVTIVNDARAFTLAEARVGAGVGSETLVCMTLGTGVGGGVAIGGKLHSGAWGPAGELGHQTIIPDGPRCGCGNRGCVEALAQAEALAKLADRPTVDDVFAGVRDGDQRSCDAVATVAGYLGIGLANVVTVLGADRVVIGGGIIAAGELILGPIREAVRERLYLVPRDEVSVVPAALGGSAGAIGAALAANG